MNDSAELLECVVDETGPEPEATVIWLHGLGADGHDFAPIVPQLTTASRRAVRFVFPHARVRPVTINGGMAMRAWYDILEMSIDRDQDSAGIAQSVAAVGGLIEAELARGVAAARIVLAGFSQGGAIALRCGLARPEPLAGIVALSCYLLEADRLDSWMSPAAAQRPVFMGHGEHDAVVPVWLGQQAAQRLQAAGLPVSWHTWPIQHAVCMQEIAAIDAWLERHLP